MPTNPHIIPLLPRDPGTAQKTADLNKAVQNIAKAPVIFGEGVRVTGGLIETTSEPGVARAYMRGGPWVDDANPPGIFVTGNSGEDFLSIMPGWGITLLDPDGQPAVSLTSFAGISIEAGNSDWNGIGWNLDGIGVANVRAGPDFTGSFIVNTMKVTSPNGFVNSLLEITAANDGRGHVLASASGRSVTVVDDTGNGNWGTGDLSATNVFSQHGDLEDIITRVSNLEALNPH